jgi:hypothetical protein
VRRFDQPQLFKPFVSRCEMKGNIEIGSVREVNVKSGLPATRSTERLELLDDDERILSVRFVGGDHRLQVCSVLHLSIFCAAHARYFAHHLKCVLEFLCQMHLDVLPCDDAILEW